MTDTPDLDLAELHAMGTAYEALSVLDELALQRAWDWLTAVFPKEAPPEGPRCGRSRGN